MKTKKPFYALIGAAGILLHPYAHAGIVGYGTLTISAPGYNGSPYGTGDQAGPYSITGVSVTSGPGPNYGTASPFETFCIGTTVDYAPGVQYNYQISSTIQPISGVTASGGLDYVAWGTAYLYSQFMAGVAGYGYNGTINYGASLAGSSPTAITERSEIELNDALQAAIWTLQKQPGSINPPVAGAFSGVPIQFFNGSSTSPGSVNGLPAGEVLLVDAFLTDAANAAALAHISDEAEDDGAFGVYALNLYSGSGAGTTWYQPQLCIIPEPTTMFAGAFLLLPFGISTVRFLRKSRPA